MGGKIVVNLLSVVFIEGNNQFSEALHYCYRFSDAFVLGVVFSGYEVVEA